MAVSLLQGTMFEGGTRAVSFVHGPRWLDKSGYVNNKLMHITDWMPTLLTLGEETKFRACSSSISILLHAIVANANYLAIHIGKYPH